jgi:hypothetical protein
VAFGVVGGRWWCLAGVRCSWGQKESNRQRDVANQTRGRWAAMEAERGRRTGGHYTTAAGERHQVDL